MADDAAPSTSVLQQPARLLPYLIIAVAAFGTVHLLIDLFEFGDNFDDTVSGLLTDAKTTIGGVAVLLGLYAVLAPAGGARSGFGIIDRYRTEPATHFPTLVYVLAYVSILHVIFAQISMRGREAPGLLSLFFHDLYFLSGVVGIVTVLGTAAVYRAGGRWDRDGDARQLTVLSLYGIVGFGPLYALFRFADVIDADAGLAIAGTASALLEVTVAALIVFSGLLIVRSLATPDDERDKFVPNAALTKALDAPAWVLGRSIAAVATLSAIYLLFVLTNAQDVASWAFAQFFFLALLDVATALALVYVIQVSSAAYGAMGPLETDSTAEAENAGTVLRNAVMVVAGLGILAAAFSFIAFDTFGAGEAWYYVFNRLVRAAVAVGALVGLWALHAGRVGSAG